MWRRGGKRGSDEAALAVPPKRSRNEIDAGTAKMMNQATKVRTAFHAMCSKVTRLEDEITQNDDWSWARPLTNDIDAAKSALEMAVPAAANSFMISEMTAKDWYNECVESMGEADVKGMLKDIGDVVTDKLNKLGQVVKRFHAMHAAYMRVSDGSSAQATE